MHKTWRALERELVIGAWAAWTTDRADRGRQDDDWLHQRRYTGLGCPAVRKLKTRRGPWELR